MSRQGTAGAVGSGRSRRGGDKSNSQQRATKSTNSRREAENQGRRWNGLAYRAGLTVFALAFVGVAVSITTGNQTVVIACITAAVAGGVVAAFELCRMMRNDMRVLWSDGASDPGEDEGGGGWGRSPDPEVTPPPDGMWPELEEPAWWPAFERDLNNWVPDTSDSPGA